VEDELQLTGRLQYALSFVDGHLRFAETKNAALLAVAGSVAVALLTVVNGSPGPSLPVRLYLLYVIACSGFAAVVSLMSFLPQTHLPWIERSSAPHETDNLLFFGHIRKYDPKDYWLSMSGHPATTTIPRWQLAVAEQVVINARIAARKFTMFKYAVWALMAAATTPVGAYVAYAYMHERHLSGR